ncbi:MAG: hypothetical protein QOE22_568 [Candidatus Parcubacteria bacterium]|jgi:hypothetical protein|nr:hypothetical protein [Candidatus Parcubacteria bacterium]
MSSLLTNDLISTKEASIISGYNPDYLARLCRAGVIAGKRIGRTWCLERTSLDTFIRTQQAHKQEIAHTLSETRSREYREAHQEPVTPGVPSAEKAAPAAYVPLVPARRSVPIHLRPGFAFALALWVVALSGYASVSDAFIGTARDAGRLAYDLAVVRAITYDGPAVFLASRDEPAPNVPDLHIPDQDVLVAEAAQVAASDVTLPDMATRHNESRSAATLAGSVGASRIAAVSAFFRTPGASFAMLRDTGVGAYVRMGASIERFAHDTLVQYATTVESAGADSLELASAARDMAAFAPARAEAIRIAYERGIYAWVERTPDVARGITERTLALGDALGGGATLAPNVVGNASRDVAIAVAAGIATPTRGPVDSTTPTGIAAASDAHLAAGVAAAPAALVRSLEQSVFSAVRAAHIALTGGVRLLAGLFDDLSVALTSAPERIVTILTPAASGPGAYTATTTNTTYVDRFIGDTTVVRNYYPQTFLGGVSREEIDARFTAFDSLMRRNIESALRRRGGGGGGGGGGGSISLNDPTFTGTLTTDDAVVNNNLSVGNDTTIGGNLDVGGDANVTGTLTVGSFSVSNLSANNTVVAPRFIGTSTSEASVFPNIIATTSVTDNATSTNLYATNFGIGNSYFTSLLGNGLVNTGGMLSVSTSSLASGFFQNGGNAFGVPAVLGTTDNQPLSLITNNTTAATILGNGNVGIGTTSPFTKLSVGGDAYVGGNVTATGTATVQGLSIGSLSGFLKATAGTVATSLVSLASDITGTLPVGNGGTGSTSLTGLLVGNGASPVQTASVTAPLVLTGTTLSINQANASQDGYLSSTDWNTFNNKIASTSLSGGTGISYNPATGVITNTGVTSTTGDWTGTFDGQEGSYYLANSFSTTSAAYFLSQNGGSAFSTTSANYWLSTKSTSDLAEGSNLYYTDGRVNTFINGSSTIPKTYTNNVFTGGNTFTNASSTDLYVANTFRGAGLTACNTSASKLLYDAVTGQFNCGADAGAGGGITAIGAQYSPYQTGSTQTFATTSDTNIGLVITSAGDTHTFTPTFTGTLAVPRGGTGSSTLSGILLGNGAGPVQTLGIGPGLALAGGTLSVSTTSFSGPGSNFNADLLDGQDGTYYLDRANHTGTQTASTISDFNAAVNTYIHGSTTIPKTYTANTFTATQTFGNLVATNATTTSLGLNSETFTDLTGSGLLNVGGTLTLDRTGDWTGTLDGQEGAYYLARANHTGTQLASTISDFSTTARGLFAATYPIQYDSGTGLFNLAFGTTTSNTWAGTQTFNNLVATNATTTSFGINGETFTDLTGSGLSNVGGVLTVSTSSLANLNADLLDGLDSTYFLANSFSTTSANHWLTTKSTTNLAEGSNLYYTDARVNSYIHGSTTIPKTYTNNTFTGTQTFNNLVATNATTTSLAVGTDYITDLTGSGLTITGNALTLDRTGDWTGTFDGQEGTYYLNRANHSGTQLASTISDFSEATDDRVAVLIQNGTGISWSYNDGANTFTPTVTLAPFTTTNLAEGSNLYYTDGRVASYINASTTILNDSTEAGLETFLTDVANVFTNNDGALSDDDLSNNSIEDLSDVAAMTENYGDLLGWNGTTWTDFATSSLGLITSAVQNIGPAGQTADGPTVTFATTTSTTNGITSALTVTGSGDTLTFTPSQSGTLTVPGGGTGASSFTAGNLIYGAGTGALQSVATSSVSSGTGISFTGTPGALVGGTPLTISNTGVLSFNGRTGAVTPQSGDYTTTIVAEGTNLYYTDARVNSYIHGSTTIPKTYTANTFTALNTFSAGASTTQLTATGNAYLATAGGNVSVGGTTASEKLTVTGNILSSNLAGVGNRCVYADLNGVLRVAADNCGLAGAGGDDLGNHIATQNIQLNNNWLSNDGGSEGVSIDNSGNVTMSGDASAASFTRGGDTITDFTGTGLTVISGALTVSTSSLANLNADLLDSLDSTYFLANSFSTTSANYWLTTKDTDDLAEGSTNLYYTDGRVNTFIAGSTTIPKTYTNNTFGGTQTFNNLLATNATTTSFGINSETFTDLTGSGLLNVGGTLTLDRTGNWTGTFDGQEGTYYLARANHTGTQLASTISDFNDAVANYVNASSTILNDSTEAGLEAFLTDVTNVFTNNDGALNDDDLTNNSIEDLSDVATMTENYGDLLYWNGTAWADIATSSLGLPTASITNIGPTGQMADGPNVTLATSTSAFNGLTSSLTITGSGDTLTFVPALSGTLNNAGLTNSTVSYGGVTLSLGGSDATPAFDLTDATNLPIVGGTTGTLTVPRGGTGQVSFTASNLIYGAGTGALQSVATTTVSATGPLSFTANPVVIGASPITLSLGTVDISSNTNLAATYPIVLTGDTLSLAFGTTTSNTWAGTQTFNNLVATNATTTSLGLNGETFTDLTGSGLLNVGGTLTLDRTGDWTGTFDGQEGSYYLNRANHTGTQAASTISDFSEATDDRVAVLIQNGTGISWSYNDGANTFTPTVTLAPFTTTNLAEGTNLYYTDARVNSFVHSSTTIPKTYTANTFTGAQTFNGGLTLGTLNGPLQANNGIVSATTSIGVLYGGTGLTIAPTYGQLLVGNSSGGYTLTSTSSLGLITQAVQNIGPAGQMADGPNVTFATSTASFNGLTQGITITGSGDTITFTPSLSGTLGVGGGGTGAASFAYGLVLSPGGTGALTNIATSSLGLLTTNVAEGSNLYFTDERVDDRVAVLIQNGTGISWSYNDGANAFTPTVTLAPFTTTNLAEGSNLYYTDARVASYINASTTILNDSTEAGLEAFLTDVTNVFTNNDGTLADDDLTNNSIEDLSDVAAMTENYGDLLYWNGSAWADIATSSLGLLSTAVTNIGPAGQMADGPTVTFATTTSTTNGITSALTITGSGDTLTFTPSQSGTLTVPGGGTGATSFTAGNLVYGTGTGALQSVATTTLSGNSQIALSQPVVVIGASPSVLSITADSIGDAQLAFNTGQNLTTASSPTFASLTLTNPLAVTSGGTGWAAIQAGAIPYGNGTGALATTTAGTNGNILALLNGIPTWTSTSTFLLETEVDTEAELETLLTDVTNVFTNNDGALADDDLTNNSIEDLSDVAAMTENYGDLLYWNGTAWADIATSSLGLVTSALTSIGPAGQQQTGPAITLASSTAGTDFTITAAGNTVTFNLPTASATNRGLLSSADWSTFNGKENVLSFTYPLVRTVNNISLAFGTTTSNTWAGTQTFNNLVATNATTTSFAIGSDYITDLTGSGLTVTGNALTLDRTGDWTGTFDGQEGTYYLARANHTGTQLASTISDFSEATDDRVAVLIQNGTGISWSYNDGANTFTPTVTLAPFTTTNLAEGTNLYYTDARVNSYIAASTTIPKTYTSNTFTGLQTLNGGLTLGTLNGPLQANVGVVSATTSIGVLYGGTGLTIAPTYGQLLVGNASGGYTLTATSSLGLASAATAFIQNGNSFGATAVLGTNDANDLQFETSGTTKLTILQNGNVGIGTTTPSNLLHVFSSSASPRIRAETSLTSGSSGFTAAGESTTGFASFSWNNSGAANSTFLTLPNAGLVRAGSGASGGLVLVNENTSAPIIFATGGSSFSNERLRIDSAGNVGIGTTTPFTMLSVNGNIAGNHLVPNGAYTDNLSPYDLGAIGSRWNALWAGTLNIGTSTWSINNGSDGRLSVFDAASGGGTERFSILTNGNVGIGSTTPFAKLSLAGGNFWQTAGDPVIASSTDTTAAVNGVYVAGRYAYLTPNSASPGLVIMDVSNPRSPAQVGSANTTGNAKRVVVSGRYAYVLSARLHIFDVTNPASPSAVGNYNPGVNIPNDIWVSGKYAYLARSNFSTGAGSLAIVDLSNPALPIAVSSINSPDSTRPFNSIYVSGRYAYVGTTEVSGTTGRLYIYDISNPTAPSLVGTFNATNRVTGVYVSGRYAYLSGLGTTSGLEIVDVSNPASPALAGSFNTANDAMRVQVSGNYAYIAEAGTTDGIVVVDVSQPGSPVQVGSYTTANSANNLYVSGKYIYVATNGTTGGFQVLDAGGAQLPLASIGNINTNLLTVDENANFGGEIYAQGGINAGISGIFSRGTISAYVASSTQTNPTVANFMGGSVGIGTTTPYAALSVVGINTAVPTLSIKPAASQTANILDLYTFGSLTSVIDAAGNWGISTTSPWKTLSVGGDFSLTGAFFDSGASSGTNGMVLQTTGSGTQWVATSSLGISAGLTGSGCCGQVAYWNGASSLTGDAAFTFDGTNLSLGTGQYLVTDSEGAPGYSWTGDTTTGIYHAGASTIGFSTGGIERMRIDGNGYLGISTTSPGQMLSVEGDAYISGATVIGDTGLPLVGPALTVNGFTGIASSSPWGLLSVNPNAIGTAPSFVVGSSSATNFIVANGGSVGIGMTAPSSRFQVADINRLSGTSVSSAGFGNTNLSVYTTDAAATNVGAVIGLGGANLYGGLKGASQSGTSAGYLGFYTNSFSIITGNTFAERARITSSGQLGIGTTTPFGLLAVAGPIAGNHIIPNGPYTDNLSAYDLGATGSRWNALWAGTVNIGTSTWSINNGSDGRLSFFDAASGGGNERLSLLTNGNVGIGTTSPAARLAITSNAAITSDSIDTYLANTVNAGTVSGTDRLITGNYTTLSPTVTLEGATLSAIANKTLVNAGNVTLGSTALSGVSGSLIGDSIEVTGSPIFNDPDGNDELNATFIGTQSYVNLVPSVTSVSGGNLASYGGLFTNSSSNSSGNLGAGAYGVSALVGGNPLVNGYRYGFYSTVSGTSNENTGYWGAVSGGTGSNYGSTLIVSGGAVSNYGNYVGISGGNNNYGSYISLQASSTNYAIYATGGAQSYFSGNVGIGTTTPWATLAVNPVAGGASNAFAIGSSTATRFLVTNGGNVGIGTTTPGTLLSLGDTGANTINISATATSTFGSGINIRTGCFAVNGVCVGGGGGGTINSGTTGQFPYYAANGTTLTATSTLLVSTASNVGIGTTTPSARLAITGTGTGTGRAFAIANSSDAERLSVLDNGSTAIISSSATAFTVGPSGATNPVLTLNASTGSGVTGISITNGTTGGTTAIVATDSGSNSSLSINPKGTGTLNLGTTNTGNVAIGNNSAGSNINGSSVALRVAGSDRISHIGSAVAFTVTTAATASSIRYSFAGAADTNLTASTEAPSTYFNLGQTRQHATGALTLQRDFRITPSTHSFAGASALTTAATFALDSGPIGSTNATISTSTALLIGGVGSTALANTTNGYGLMVFAPTGATNNYGASFVTGNVGVGTTSPWSKFSVTGTGAWDGLAGTGDTLPLCINNTTKEIVAKATGACTTGSDARLKENIVPLRDSYGLSSIDALRPVEFDYKDPSFGTGHQEGLIAQEVLSIFPNLVSTSTPTRFTPDVTYTLNYQGLVIPMVKAIQELSGRTSALSLATSTLSVRLGVVEAGLADANGTTVGPITATTLSADSANVRGTVHAARVTADAFMSAPRYFAPDTEESFAVGSTTQIVHAPAEALTSSGVDIYKLATYSIARIQSLEGRMSEFASRLDLIDARLAALESQAGTGLGGLFAGAFENVDAIVENGIAYFRNIKIGSLLVAKNDNGTSAAGVGTILEGNTVVEIANPLARPSSKIFITLTSPLEGSWYLSDKGDGSFRVRLSQAQSSDVTFDYFIVQTEGNDQTPQPPQEGDEPPPPDPEPNPEPNPEPEPTPTPTPEPEPEPTPDPEPAPNPEPEPEPEPEPTPEPEPAPEPPPAP